MVRQLRQGNDRIGLVLANGGVLSHHHAVCLSRRPRSDGAPYPNRNPLPQHVSDAQPLIAEWVQGSARIEVSCALIVQLGLLMTEMMNRHTRFNTIAMGHLLRVLSWVA